jgi:beta-lactamase regulating signal transducer with metallopeptidase domain
MNSFLALRQLLIVGDLFAASTLIMALAWLAPFRKMASLRHLAWVAAFGALLVLPLLLAIVPSHIRFALAAPAATPAIAAPQTAMVAATMPAVAASLPQAEAFHLDFAMAVRALIAVWLLGVLFIAVRSAVAMFGLNNLRRNSVGHIFRELPKIAQGYEIRIAPDECGPVTWGFVRPIILLPKSADYWPAERVTAVLLHEIAHIRRRDSLTQMLSLLVCALYWPNPFVWIGARAMRREAEIAADDAVIVSGVRPSYYAAELVYLAAQFRARPPALLNMPMNVPMAERAALEARVESILAQTQQRTGATTMDVLKLTTAGIAAAATLAFARPSLAQDAPPPPPPPAVAAPAAPPAPVVQAELPVPPAAPHIALSHHPHHIQIMDERRTANGQEERHIYVDGRELDPNSSEYSDVSEQERAAMAQEHDAMARENEEMARERAEMAREAADMRAEAAAVRAEQPRIEEAVRNAQPQIERALEEARAEIAKVDDAKIRAKVDAALARAEERLAHAHAGMEGAHIRIEMDGDHGDAPDMPVPPPPPAP